MNLCLTGDIYLGDAGVPQLEGTAEFSAIWDRADFRIINFEAPVVDVPCEPTKKIAPVLKHSYQCVQKLKEMRANYWCLANNHMGDFGLRGIDKTIQAIGADHVLGAHVDRLRAWHNPYEPRFLEKEGIKLALFCFAEGETGILTRPGTFSPIAYVRHPIVRNKIIEVKESVDFIVAIVHAGIEDISIPQPEWRSVYRELVEYGVNAVIAHHPHVPQGYEWLKAL